jgi:hypothetical protein
MGDYADLEIGLHRRDVDHYAVELRFTLPDAETETRLARDGLALVQFDVHHLRTLTLDAAAYGRTLTTALFAAPSLLAAFAQIRSTAHAHDLPLPPTAALPSPLPDSGAPGSGGIRGIPR